MYCVHINPFYWTTLASVAASQTTCEIGIHVSHQLLVATCHVDFLYAAQSAHN